MAKATREKMVLVLAVLSLISVCRAVTPLGRKKLIDLEIRKELKRLNKPAIKSIKMRPSFYDGNKKMSSLEPPLEQLWHKSGSCPEGTIPIRRTRKEDLLRDISSRGLETSLPSQIEVMNYDEAPKMTMRYWKQILNKCHSSG
ncbi:hypothetical protein CKAN_00079500 [Cinnamomum micranthum f. kanehirae]|uniref:Neprosin activation peptide domain-containing protein n=1 Tax=Cinnamomum micranthum f. kanehirae TaxID=337451 RepID=A0A3S4N467_9MAGN|nr:hypothetical protein CKAN_00079500 [Cinnamomum micranthum f. kanehirae]